MAVILNDGFFYLSFIQDLQNPCQSRSEGSIAGFIYYY
jgi:hypothetical protein